MKKIKINWFIMLLVYLYGISINASSIELLIIDKSTQKTVPARVLILSEDNKSYYPEQSVLLNIGTETWFMSPGQSEIDVPEGNYILRIERGKEYKRIKEKLRIPYQNNYRKEVLLERWIDMNELGYSSGENHLHRIAEDIAVMCAAEDLDFGSSLQWWNYPRFGVPDGSTNVLNLEFGGETIPVSVYDVEVEENWGAIYLINLSNPFPFLHDKKMPNLIAAEYGREKGALICYQAGYSREVLIDALLGYVDVVNVCNNNFHMHRYQPRSRYSNLLNAEGLPVYPNTPAGMMRMNTDTYYRLLNCGLRLAAGAGSATGAKETPVGFNRTYARSKPEEGINEFMKAWKEGKNFVTNGPMLFLRTSENLQPGDTLNISENKKVTLNIKTISDSPLGSVEIVVNGDVVKSFKLGEDQKIFEGSLSINVDESSWICARATDTDMLLNESELEKYRGPRVKLFQDPNRLRYAHTSPIYFYMNGKNIAVKKSIEEGLKIIGAFKKYASENASEEYVDKILTATDMAKEILDSKLSERRN